ncbi:MAG: type IV toxin-antitoxin system AbiEi family antitoxin domain-containing protein [Nocardioides sp.]
MEPLRPLDELGVITRAQALREGLDDRAIRRALKRGDWVALRHGAYVDAARWQELDERNRHRATAVAVSSRAGAEHVWSHVTALAHLQQPLWEVPLDCVHVTRFDGRAGRRSAGVVQHRGRLIVDDLTRRDGQLLTSPTRTALDVAGLTDVEHGVVIVGSMLNSGETSPAALRQCLESMTAWPNTLTLHRVLQLADPRPESVAEHRLVYWFWRLRLPPPIPQFEVIADGRRYRVDFAWPEHGFWLEFDGKDKYGRYLRPGETHADAVLREKLREDAIREATGWRCIRVTWADLADPARLERRIRRLLERVAS